MEYTEICTKYFINEQISSVSNRFKSKALQWFFVGLDLAPSISYGPVSCTLHFLRVCGFAANLPYLYILV